MATAAISGQRQEPAANRFLKAGGLRCVDRRFGAPCELPPLCLHHS